MKVQNMTSANGNKIANQFIIENNDDTKYNSEVFQSYDSVIVKRMVCRKSGSVYTYLDTETWDYSTTTSKYRNQFLGETTKETQSKIDSGEYILCDLNA